MTKRVVVPEGMLESARREVLCGDESLIRSILEAGLSWLSENPIEPTAEQYADITLSSGKRGDGGWQWRVKNAGKGPSICAKWQRRMFRGQ
jgi:hypothetical protein